MPAPVRLVTIVLLACVPAVPLAAQSSWHAHVDLIAVHDYRWRGIKRASGWNAQLEGMARFGSRTTGLTVGAWNNFELGTHKNGALSDLRPGHWGTSETNLWIEGAHTFPCADVAAGFIWYEYKGRAGAIDTKEVYARFREHGQNSRRISAEASIWYDVGERGSGYVEAGLTAPALALPLRGLGLLAYGAATAGFAIGEPEDRPALASTTFARKGFTSADLSIGLRLDGEESAGGLLLRVAGHLQYARDEATRRSWLDPPERSSRFRPYLTLGLGIRWPAPKDR